jgi:hypothetical protein
LKVLRLRRVVPAFMAVGLVGLLLLVPAALAGGSPAIAFAPASTAASPFAFAKIAKGATETQTFTLKNTGGVATAALTVSLTGSAAFTRTADSCSAVSLGPKKSCSITVQYAPTTDGASDTATLTARSKKPLAVATAYLSGTSTDPSADISLTYIASHDGFPPGLVISNGGPSAATVSVLVHGVSSLGTNAAEQVTGDATTGFTVTTVNPIPSGGAANFYLAGLVSTSAYAEVTASSAPDPDSTPNNQVTTEDDYLAISGTVTQSNYDCAAYGGTYATGTGSALWTCSQWLAIDSAAQDNIMINVLLVDCASDGGFDVLSSDDPSSQTDYPMTLTSTCYGAKG